VNNTKLQCEYAEKYISMKPFVICN